MPIASESRKRDLRAILRCDQILGAVEPSHNLNLTSNSHQERIGAKVVIRFELMPLDRSSKHILVSVMRTSSMDLTSGESG